MKRAGWRDVPLIVLVGIGWGLLAPATKALHAEFPAWHDGITIAASRGAWAFPLFLALLAFTWRRERPRLEPRRALALIAAGLCFGLGITILFAIAAMHTSIAHLSFLIGSSPVTNSAAAALAFRLRLGGRERLALVLGIAGIALLTATQTGGTAGLFGDALMLLWLVGFAAYSVFLRYGGAGLSSLFAMSVIGTVAMGAILVVCAAIPGALRGIPHVADSPASAAWFFGEIILGSTLISQTAYAAAVRRFGVAVATIGAEYTAVAIGIGYSLAVREPWTWLTVVAGVLLVAALGVTFVPAQKPLPAVPA